MALNEVFREADNLSLPVPTGTLDGTPLRIGALNVITTTDEGSVIRPPVAGGPMLSRPSGGVGNAPGYASVRTSGGWLVPVAGACTVGGVVFIKSQVVAPVLTLGTTSTTGGTLAAGATFWKVTATDAAGETVGSNEVTATLTGTTSSQPLSWVLPANATGIKVYRGTVAGSENVLVTTLGAVSSYTDTGAAGTPASVPTVGTTAAASLTSASTGNFTWGVSLQANAVTTVKNVIVKINNNAIATAAA